MAHTDYRSNDYSRENGFERSGRPEGNSHGSSSVPPRSSRRGRVTIDGRGSIDSRTFDETREISSVTSDKRDRSRVLIDPVADRTRWHSRSEVPAPERSNQSTHVNLMQPYVGRQDESATRTRIIAVVAIAILIIAIVILWLWLS